MLLYFSNQVETKSLYLLRLDFREVTDWELLCQFRFLWLMNQLLICFSCNPVSSTSFALSSSWKKNKISNNVKWVRATLYTSTLHLVG